MKVELTGWQLIAIDEALSVAPAARNYDNEYLRQFRLLREKLAPLVYNTREMRSIRRRYMRAVKERSHAAE